MRKKRIGILLIFAIGLSGCKTQPQVTDNATVKTDGVELIKDAGNLSRDSAQCAVETLYNVGAERVKTAELVSEKQGVVLKATDTEGTVYYLGFGGSGYLEMIRKDSPDGEILYAPID